MITMKNKCILLAFLFVTFPFITFGYELKPSGFNLTETPRSPTRLPQPRPSPPPPPPGTLDHLQMVFTWPPTYCRYTPCIQEALWFKLHGLWPADARGITLPPGTRTGPDIVQSLSTQLQRRLTSVWPSNQNGQNNRQFWNNQWYRHGVLTRLTAETYFQRVVTLWDGINNPNGRRLVNLLRDSGIRPDGSSRGKSEYIAAIQRELNYNIYVSCYPFAGRTLLFEIYFCSDLRTATLRDCPVNNDRKGCGLAADPSIEFPDQNRLQVASA